MKFFDLLSLYEWKEDLAKGNVLYHYTDIDGLENILKSHRINKNWYDFNNSGLKRKPEYDNDEQKYAEKNGKKVPIIDFAKDMDATDKERKGKFGEIATMRPSSSLLKAKMGTSREKHLEKEMKGIDDMLDLSEHYFLAEITLFKDAIQSGLRDVKRNKVAEYPKQAFAKLQREVIKLKNAKTSTEEKSLIRDFNINTIQDVSKQYKKWQDIRAQIYNNPNTKRIGRDIDRYFRMFFNHSAEDGREGEERFTQDIPLEKRFAKIRLLSSALKEKSEELKSLVIKNADLFYQDQTFKEYIKA
jgi:hypothetical protein